MVAKNKHSGVKRTRRQTFWERIWASTILLYTVGATLIVWRTLGKYGVNPLVFFVIDGITSWTYGISTARLTMTVIKRKWKEARKWAWASAISFVTPQIYVLAAAHHAPRDVYLIVIAVISILILLAFATLMLQIRKSKKVVEKDVQ